MYDLYTDANTAEYLEHIKHMAQSNVKPFQFVYAPLTDRQPNRLVYTIGKCGVV